MEQKTMLLGTLIFMIIVLLVAGFFSCKQYSRHQRIQMEVTVLETQREKVRKENESLKERIHYFATDEFKEQESKERLNMRKNNEYVVEIEQATKKEDGEQSKAGEKPVPDEDTPYYKKWWAKIFE